MIDFNEETDSTSAQEKGSMANALTGWEDEQVEGDAFVLYFKTFCAIFFHTFSAFRNAIVILL